MERPLILSIPAGVPGYQSHTAVFQQNVVYSVFRRQSHEQIRTFQKYFSQAMSSFMAKTVEPLTAGQSFPGKAGQGTGWHNAQKRVALMRSEPCGPALQ